MIQLYRHRLSNGLAVIVVPDRSTPMATLNVVYHVGAKHEDPNRTGFAHLFEHLMFGGSVNIPDYDSPLQEAGGENNAFTTNDLTNYYLTLPKENIETGFWLESDRMLGLAFSEDALRVQQQVVVEEFKQRYLNQPYGDVWPLVRELAYTVHPYRWATIGKEISHIEQATLGEVKQFFYRYYNPANAALVIAGNVDLDESIRLAEKWFGTVPGRPFEKPLIPAEPEQTAFRELTVERDVPANALHMAFHMPGRLDQGYYVCDLLSDVLSNGNSSRLFQRLVQQQKLFSELDAYISGDNDPGLFLISGKLNGTVSMGQAAQAVWNELDVICSDLVDGRELAKVKNKLEANHIYGQMNYLNLAQEVALFESLSKAEIINEQLDYYRSISAALLRETAQQLFRKENCSQLNYLAKQQK